MFFWFLLYLHCINKISVYSKRLWAHFTTNCAYTHCCVQHAGWVRKGQSYILLCHRINCFLFWAILLFSQLLYVLERFSTELENSYLFRHCYLWFHSKNIDICILLFMIKILIYIYCDLFSGWYLFVCSQPVSSLVSWNRFFEPYFWFHILFMLVKKPPCKAFCLVTLLHVLWSACKVSDTSLTSNLLLEYHVWRRLRRDEAILLYIM